MSPRIALAQINPTVGDLAGNADLIYSWAAEATQSGAQVVVFPEMALTGYPIDDLAGKPGLQRAAKLAIAKLAQRLDRGGMGACQVVVGGLGTNDQGQPVDIAAVLHRGQVQQVYAKRHLPATGDYDQCRVFAAGHRSATFAAHGARLGLAIGHDIWSAGQATGAGQAGKQPAGRLANRSPALDQDQGAPGLDALLVLGGSAFELGQDQACLAHARRQTKRLDAAVVYVNLVGGQDDLVFDGGSFALNAQGDLVCQAGRFAQELVSFDLAEPATELVPKPELAEEEAVYRAITLGLGDYARKGGFAKAILGLSGGIDSALVATLAVDALGAANVTGVAMPSAISSQHSLDDAADLASRLGLDFRTVPINDLVEPFVRKLNLAAVGAENIQARVRGMVLMGISNMEGHLVLATGNKSELAAGYSTIYGDAVGGYAPIRDVYKTQVWALARWRNTLARQSGQVEPIPERSIAKPPSAELRPGQLDTDSLPEYDILDPVLQRYVEQGWGPAELASEDHPAAAVELAVRLADKAEWKRRQYPPGPKVTAVAFGRDRRLPMTNRWQEV
ncbi:MAG: NAD+ synthase [Micrococcales bacterium]|nr:NAD+ synthase [Micrococcales bacterium]